MPYDEHLADRIRDVFKSKKVVFEEKKMMGGLCFMVNDKMCVGVMKNKFMARVDPAFYPAALKKKGCHPMDFTGRVLKGFVLVSPAGVDADDDLGYWMDRCLEFNPKAKASKKQ